MPRCDRSAHRRRWGAREGSAPGRPALGTPARRDSQRRGARQRARRSHVTREPPGPRARAGRGFEPWSTCSAVAGPAAVRLARTGAQRAGEPARRPPPILVARDRRRRRRVRRPPLLRPGTRRALRPIPLRLRRRQRPADARAAPTSRSLRRAPDDVLPDDRRDADDDPSRCERRRGARRAQRPRVPRHGRWRPWRVADLGWR